MTSPAVLAWRLAPIDPARIERAASLQVTPQDGGYRVVGLRGNVHFVSWMAGEHVCDCADHVQRGLLCKHALAVLLHERDERALLALARYTPPTVEAAAPTFCAGQRLGVLGNAGEWLAVEVVAPPDDAGDLLVRPAGWGKYRHLALPRAFFRWNVTLRPAERTVFRRPCQACDGVGVLPSGPLTASQARGEEYIPKADPCPACQGTRWAVYDPWKPGKIEQSPITSRGNAR